ncbi:MAG: FGGY-family carbohydrate kinase [Clostridiales bacterium]|nr:FGGY-family carbohydrate kinase [Clostridiales bacterium]
MMEMRNRIQIAIADIGAGTGRVVRGLFDGERLVLEEVHRFANGYVQLQGDCYWDILKILDETMDGLRKAATPDAPASFSVDSWGADYCEFDATGKLLGLPRSYRDPRTKGIPEEIAGLIGEEEWREITGTHPLDHLTICQLYASKALQPARFAATSRILYIPDAIHYFLTGEEASDYTNNSATGAYDWKGRRFSDRILSRLSIDGSLFAPERPPGTVLGAIVDDALKDTALSRTKAVVTGGHDSGLVSIVMPAEKGICLLNCGTWGVLGYRDEGPHPRSDAFVNFGAVAGGYYICKIFNAMWYLQECKKRWDMDGMGRTYPLLEEAARASSYEGVFDVEDPCFQDSHDMPKAIAEYMKRSKQPGPGSPGDFARAILRSIALQCAAAVSDFKLEAGVSFQRCYFIGGANRNRLFCQTLADTAGMEIIIGPSEGTAYANGCVQLAALGELKMADIPDFAGKEAIVSPGKPPPASLMEKYLDLKNNGG